MTQTINFSDYSFPSEVWGKKEAAKMLEQLGEITATKFELQVGAEMIISESFWKVFLPPLVEKFAKAALEEAKSRIDKKFKTKRHAEDILNWFESDDYHKTLSSFIGNEIRYEGLLNLNCDNPTTYHHFFAAMREILKATQAEYVDQAAAKAQEPPA